MSNDYFQFKQFRIEQGRCAMKVTTDACLLGAWTPLLPDVKRVLDVGTGTGLLGLMLAQRNTGMTIDSVEIDPEAADQARGNVALSPWSDRITVIAGDVRKQPLTAKYDLIISNPPFFNNSLLSNDAVKDAARHTLHLSYDDLLDVILSNLADDGYASILLPAPEYQLWKELSEDVGLFESYKLLISHAAGVPVKRIVGLFSKNEPSFSGEDALVIKDANGRYTQGFVNLLAPFYLDLKAAGE